MIDFVAIVLAVSNAASIWALVLYLKARDLRDQEERNAERQDRQLLLNRVQAPEIAVAQAIEVPTPEGLGYVPIDDDDAFRENVEELRG